MKISYGIIVYHKKNKKFLLVQRKDSYAYIQLCKNYHTLTPSLIETYIHSLTKEEVRNLLQYTPIQIWNQLFLKREYTYYVFKNRSLYNIKLLQTKYKSVLQKIIDTKKYIYSELEWSFPKGGKNYNESRKQCAIREFREETNINVNLTLLTVEPISTMIYKKKCIFYIGLVTDDELPVIRKKYENCVSNETKNVKWFTENEIIKLKYIHSNYINLLKKSINYL